MGLTRLQLVGKKVKASFCQQDSLHVSLSRPVAVPESETPRIVKSLRHRLVGQKGGSIFIEESVIALPSKSTRRVFVAAPIAQVSAERVLIPLLQRVDQVYNAFGLPTFFEDPLLHMSFASTETTAIQSYFPKRTKPSNPALGGLEAGVDAVYCEIGQRQCIILLA
eukprot:IDg15674t1